MKAPALFLVFLFCGCTKTYTYGLYKGNDPEPVALFPMKYEWAAKSNCSNVEDLLNQKYGLYYFCRDQ